MCKFTSAVCLEMCISADDSKRMKQKLFSQIKPTIENRKKMKKYYAEIIFVSPDMHKVHFKVGTKSVDTFLRAESFLVRQAFEVTINLPKLPTAAECDAGICLLSDEAIAKILNEGEGGESFETEEQIREAFTFDVYRHRGYINHNGKKAGKAWLVIGKNFASAGRCDIPKKERLMQNSFVMCQLVRFGVLDKFKIDP